MVGAGQSGSGRQMPVLPPDHGKAPCACSNTRARDLKIITCNLEYWFSHRIARSRRQRHGQTPQCTLDTIIEKLIWQSTYIRDDALDNGLIAVKQYYIIVSLVWRVHFNYSTYKITKFSSSSSRNSITITIFILYNWWCAKNQFCIIIIIILFSKLIINCSTKHVNT